MAKKHTSQTSISPETQQEAAVMAKAIQKQGQNKDQTKLIAQGIQKGIALYKQQQKEKARQVDKQKKKTRQSVPQPAELDTVQSSKTNDTVQSTRSILPWTLLLISWVGFLSLYLLK